MKFVLTLSIATLFLVLFNSVSAQDIITMKSGDELNGKILRLNPTDVYFIPRGIHDTVTILRDEIVKLQYQNGTLVNLTDHKLINAGYTAGYDSMYYVGVNDARRYYVAYKGATIGTLVSAVVFPFNIIPAIACSASRPQEDNLGYPDQKLKENKAYEAGYKAQAHKIKKQKVWQNYAIGSAAVIAFYIIVSAASY